MDKKIFDLHQRTEKFSQAVIELVKKIPENLMTKVLISQLVRAATSIGANYCEADNASSKRDFKNKICLCRKESAEARYWLKMIGSALPYLCCKSSTLEMEAKELNLIFSTIFQNTH